MKKALCVAIALLMLLLAACTDPFQSTEPTPPQKEPSAPQAAEPIEPSEEPDQPDLFWLPEQTQKLPAEDYFAEDRPYYGASFWLIESGDTSKGYTLKLSEVGLQVCTYDANPWDEEEGEILFDVPDSESLFCDELIGTNGITACFLDRDDVTGAISGIFLVDLVTGKRTNLIQDAVIMQAGFLDDVIFYTTYQNGQILIVRHYIPTGDITTISTGQAIPALFSMSLPASTQGAITWSGISEDVTEKLLAELKNPDSKYQKPPFYEGMDFSFLWKDDQSLIDGSDDSWYWVCYYIQEDTGMRPILNCKYDPLTGEKTEKTGIIDNCWFGSGYPHNHFDPDAPAPGKPVSSIGDWHPFVEEMKATEPETLNHELESYHDCYYQVNGNTFTLLTDTPLHSYVRIMPLGDGEQEAYYGITRDNAFIRIYTDGSAPTVLYQGQEKIWTASDEGTRIYLGDGDTIVELDLQTQQWRTVFTHADLSWFYCDYGNENVLYIDLASGLHVVAYLYDLTTGKLTETGYRL